MGMFALNDGDAYLTVGVPVPSCACPVHASISFSFGVCIAHLFVAILNDVRL